MKFKENTIFYAQKNMYGLQDILDVILKAIIHSAQGFVNIFFFNKTGVHKEQNVVEFIVLLQTNL